MIEYIYLLVILFVTFSIGLIILTYLIIKLENENTNELYFIIIIVGLVIVFFLPLLFGIIDLLLKNL